MGEERRKLSGLSQEEITLIRDEVLASVYEEIGRSVVKKALWVIGAAALAAAGWLTVSHIQIK